MPHAMDKLLDFWLHVDMDIWMDGNGQLSREGEGAEFESRSTLEALLI